MSMKISGPSDQGFGLSNLGLNIKQGLGSGEMQTQKQTGGLVDFGASSASGAQNAGVNFGRQASPLSNTQTDATSQAAGGGQLTTQMINFIQQLALLLLQLLQSNQTASNDPSQNNGTTGSGPSPVSSAGAAQPASAAPQGDNGVAPASAQAAPAGVVATPDATPVDPSAAAPVQAAGPTQAAAPGQPSPAPATSGPQATDASAPVGDGPTAGTGPRSFNITNTQDHPIKIGQFDKDGNLTAELNLKPNQTGTMKFENDTTGLLKQAAADNTYKSDASRLEFYNGFINTSYIDGRNAAIHATDGKGFEIGDTQSIADKAPGDIVSSDSDGNKTIAGFYDGSTDKMKKGGDFLTQTLGTGMTYMHPDDDTLGAGKNPMRHTDAMSLNVTFGKA